MNYLLMYMNLLIMSLFIYTFIFKQILMTLIILEFIMLNIFMILSYSMFSMNNYYLLMYYLIFVVCESAMGLTLLIMIIRNYGNDSMKFLNLILW